MADEVSIKIEGIEEVVKKLGRATATSTISPAIKAATLHLKGTIAIYPPSTVANSPSQPRWYERGYGPRWRLAGGGIGGRKTSENLGRKWTTRTQGLSGMVGNNVSYAPFVQGLRQARFHKRHGWRNTAQVAEEQQAKILQFITDTITKALR